MKRGARTEYREQRDWDRCSMPGRVTSCLSAAGHVPRAHTQTMNVPVLRWLDPPEGPAVALLDQTRLPAEEAVVICRDVAALQDAIRRLVVRGAPILGVAGAFGVALAAAAATTWPRRPRPSAVPGRRR